jgi:hypothetical protein
VWNDNGNLNGAISFVKEKFPFYDKKQKMYFFFGANPIRSQSVSQQTFPLGHPMGPGSEQHRSTGPNFQRDQQKVWISASSVEPKIKSYPDLKFFTNPDTIRIVSASPEVRW